MANAFVLSRSHLIYGVCLPLAVLIGYVLADPLDSGSMAVVTLVFCVLSVPLIMRWHHVLLIASCNSWIAFFFAPGHPTLWMVLAFASLSLTLVNRSLGHYIKFFEARSVAYSLVCMALVVFATALFNGGIGIRSLGSSSFGGKKYVILCSAIILYFALAAQSIPRSRARLYTTLYFISSLMPLISYVGAFFGLYYLAELVPMEVAVENVESVAASTSTFVSEEINRLGDLAQVARGLACLLLALYGLKGLLDVRRPWRGALFLVALVASLYSGFRSSLVLFPLLIIAMFFLEGLYRSRHVLVAGGCLLVAGCVLIPNATRLPLSMQRALSFLPISIDPVARQDAKASTEWRLEMWRQLLPEIPRNLVKGKGYAINPQELIMVVDAVGRGTASSYELAMVAGDYHSGPLSVIIPFGLGGTLAFLWFLGAGLQMLYRNWRYGDQELLHINALLLAYFAVQVLVFFFVYGSLFGDMPVFAGIAGLSVSLNNGVRKKPEEPEIDAESVDEEEESDEE